jgi:hypothetical protein
MSISMYQASVPPMIHTLSNLWAILKKADAFVEAKKIAPSVLINARLYPDMLPLSRQVQLLQTLPSAALAALQALSRRSMKMTNPPSLS